MPTYYEGEPILTIKQSLKKEEFREAYLLQEKGFSPFHRPKVKAGICLTAALIIGSSLPFCSRWFSTIFAPVCGILTCLFLACFFVFIQPNFMRNWAEKVFESNRFLKLETSISIYRDSAVMENEWERFTEYWVHFEKCLESDRLYVLIGGINKSLLVLSKAEMTDFQRQQLTAHFKNTFATRYRKVAGS